MSSKQLRHTKASQPLRSLLALLGVPLIASACVSGDTEITSAPPLEASLTPLEAALTPSLYSEVVAFGQLAATPSTLPDGGISEERAQALATAFVSQFGEQFRPTLKRTAGRVVEVDALEPTGDVIFAETPHQPFPDGELKALRAASGPAYLVLFADPHGPAAVVSVSAYADHISIVDDRIVKTLPRGNGNEFRILGMDAGGRYGPYHTAEEAAKRAYDQFGSRVAEPPRYVRHGMRWYPMVGSWQIRLEQPVLVQSLGGDQVQTSTVYLQPDGSFTTPVGPGTSLQVRHDDRVVTLEPRADLGQTRVAVKPAAIGEVR